ncbi:hypothetical protein WJX73_009614 [Symbiochloris irregularis]|uniref:RWD domain-containing protein n=1 Tax=Symbiochloris irregularis TaxID=706552 RepID=A0AAW1NSW8_9CHLO
MDLLSRQLSEFDALQATFVEPGELELGGRITLPATLVGGRPVSLKFTLPSHYPAQPPELQVECAGSREQLQTLTAAAYQGVEDAGPETECLLLCLESVQAAASQLAEKEESDRNLPSTSAPEIKETALVCALIWFHHIKSFSKRKHILNSAQDLDVRGYCKPGFPGIIVCEGLESDVAAFIAGIRQLKWQAMSVLLWGVPMGTPVLTLPWTLQ